MSWSEVGGRARHLALIRWLGGACHSMDQDKRWFGRWCIANSYASSCHPLCKLDTGARDECYDDCTQHVCSQRLHRDGVEHATLPPTPQPASTENRDWS